MLKSGTNKKMEAKLDLLTEKIELLITKLETIQAENKQLKEDNSVLSADLQTYKSDYDNLKLSSTDKNEVVKTKLTTILNRLNQLEELAS